MGKMTKIEVKTREINTLNKMITFNYIPAISEALRSIDHAHSKLMDKYIELVELHKDENKE